MSFCLLLVFLLNFGQIAISIKCDRRPYGSTMQNTPANGEFVLEITDDPKPEKYVPDQRYTITLRRTNTEGTNTFTAFIISADPELTRDKKNPRKIIPLYPGKLKPMDYKIAMPSDRCPSSLENSNFQKKSNVEVFWQSPPAGNGCVTLRAMVAENSEVWYMDDGPLSLKICPDTRVPQDMEPTPHNDCNTCEDAKYELKFEGIWSRNTHSKGYPENEWETRYSDLIGASHAMNYTIWSINTEASSGLQHLAETGKTEPLETEIQENFSKIRTLIKSKGHSHPNKNTPTYAIFRADKWHHVISFATAIMPSPDWFLGVSRLELCNADGTWSEGRELNLYPWDAGTDSGTKYDSPNESTYPKETIKRIRLGMTADPDSPFSDTTGDQMKPFARLFIRLIRTYKRDCETDSESVAENPLEGNGEEVATQAEKRITSPTPPNDQFEGGVVMPDADESENPNCPVTPWEDWSPCTGDCNRGIQIRRRYQIVDNVIVKYDERIQPQEREVPKECEELFQDRLTETRPCPGECPSDRPANLRFDYLRNYNDNSHKERRNRPRDVYSGGNSEIHGCVFGVWSDWTPCNCNTLKKSRFRNVIKNSNHGRSNCPNKLTAYRQCYKYEC